MGMPRAGRAWQTAVFAGTRGGQAGAEPRLHALQAAGLGSVAGRISGHLPRQETRRRVARAAATRYTSAMDETLVPRQTGDTLGAPAVEALAGQAAEAERLGRLPDATVALLLDLGMARSLVPRC